MTAARDMNAIADAHEHALMHAMAPIITRSVLFNLADGKREFSMGDGKSRVQMGEDPRLPKMPARPTLLDFFRLRFPPTQNHLLQSAALARKNGLPEKMVLACLLHDIAVIGYIRSDHGYWGAQLIEPYVDEEVSWAIRNHQSLRFFPDDSVGYAYPDAYRMLFGDDYKPDDYIVEDYKRARAHKWYMSARQICVNDLYSFDPNAKVSLEEFEDVIGRHFRQPAEGLGYDNSPVAHMWRTLIRPANAL
ncbi:MAG: hypothetical protein FJX67_04800 [Alphaproteobacteria bacterium]|nr:hypothetical protein [Alphaproteobacteria bacterium]